MKTTLILVLSLLLFASLNAQQTGSISGTVVDKETKRPLEAANVTLAGTTLGTSSGTDGSFRLDNVPAGEYTVLVSYVGYTLHRQMIALSAGSTLRIDVALEPTILPGQTVVVTALRGKERETPATFSSLRREEIQHRYTYQDIPLLLAELPSTMYYSESGNGLGYNYINIRGFDQRRISVMINGIPQNDPEDHNVYWLDFPDLLASAEDVQVQRGAGSAFYGPPAIGGSVNLVTSSFSPTPKISLEAGSGSYNTQRYSVAAHSGIIANRYAFLGRLSRLKSSGYRDQSWSDFNAYYFSAVRYDDAMTTQVNFYGGPFKDHLAYYGIPKSDINDRTKRTRNPIQRPEEIENFSQPHYELLHEWRLNDRLTLNTTLFLIEGEGFFDYDASWADTTMLRLTRQYGFTPTGNPINTLVRSFVDNTQWGWLPRVTWTHEHGTATAGLELRVHRSHHWGNIRWAQNLPPQWNQPETADFRFYEYRGGKDMVSAYVQHLYRMTPTVSLMTNLQYVFNRYSLSQEKYLGTDFDVDYHFLNPRVGMNINLSEEVNAYINFAVTSREPRRKNLYDATFSWTGEVPQFEQLPGGRYNFEKPLVKPERLLNLELGAGYTTPQARLAVNAYWMDFRDEIVKSGQLDLFGQPITGNADRTRHMGVELSGELNILPDLSLQANTTVSRNTIVRHTTYVKQKNPQTGVREVVPIALDGKRLGGFPDLLANARLSYQREPWFASVSLQHVGAFYTDNFENPNRKNDAYTVVHALLGVRWKELWGLHGIEFRIQVNNLFDALYASYGVGDEFFPAAERNLFASVKVEL
jgi:iron complex outermembrane receptor protein